jgi:hypothetical protein
MAQPTYHFEGSGDAPKRDTRLDVCLGNLATSLGVAGEAWVDGNIYAHPYMVEPELFEGLYLNVRPARLPGGYHGYRVQVLTAESFPGTRLFAEHLFDDEWEPAVRGEVKVFEENPPNEYSLYLEGTRYTVNDGQEWLPDKDMMRLQYAAGLVTAHAKVVVAAMDDQYWCG